jgi:hypothetical protein
VTDDTDRLSFAKDSWCSMDLKSEEAMRSREDPEDREDREDLDRDDREDLEDRDSDSESPTYISIVNVFPRFSVKHFSIRRSW